MERRFRDPTFGGFITIDIDWKIEAEPVTVDRYCFLWNRGERPVRLAIDHVPTVLPPAGIICLAPGRTAAGTAPMQGVLAISFDHAFYCVEAHEREVSCDGLLFNGTVGAPVLTLDEKASGTFERLLDVIVEEFRLAETAQAEMLRLLLKRFIIKCTRMARRQLAGPDPAETDLELIRQYTALVERHFRSHRRVRDYAAMLFRSPKTLANAFRSAGSRSPRDILLDRIAFEARRLLHYTDRSVARIGRDLGFEDPAHFSRFFKTRTGLAPSEFRRTRETSVPALDECEWGLESSRRRPTHQAALSAMLQ